MRKVIAATFVSLDGVMQAPGAPQEDTAGGFKFGGWTFPHWDQGMGESLDHTFNAATKLVRVEIPDDTKEITLVR